MWAGADIISPQLKPSHLLLPRLPNYNSWRVGYKAFACLSSAFKFEDLKDIVLNVMVSRAESFEVVQKEAGIMEKKPEPVGQDATSAEINQPVELPTKGQVACECSCTCCAHQTNAPANTQGAEPTKEQAEKTKLDAANDYDVEDRHRRARPRRRLSYSPVRIYSPQPVIFRNRSPSPPRRSMIDEVSSHLELIPALKAQAAETKGDVPLDRSVRIEPFHSKVYVTTHAATPVDFRHWLPLLAYATPEKWYGFTDAKSLDLLVDLLAGVPAMTAKYMLPPVENARALALNVPAVAASAALRLEPNDGEEGISLLYLSVQKSIIAPQDYNEWYDRGGRRPVPDMTREGSVTGMPIYRVVRSGSRQAAASQAFYTAGGSGWSTVFTCVVADKVEAEGIPPAAKLFQRVKSLGELIEDSGDGKIRVLY